MNAVTGAIANDEVLAEVVLEVVEVVVVTDAVAVVEEGKVLLWVAIDDLTFDFP